jgi:hypothetical protein
VGPGEGADELHTPAPPSPGTSASDQTGQLSPNCQPTAQLGFAAGAGRHYLRG